MLILPNSLKIRRAPVAEESLMTCSRTWLAQATRDPRIHVSDLLDPRLGYWQRKVPMELDDRMVTTFLIGKVLHAFVLAAVDGISGKDLSSDEGERYCQDLDLVYSVDKIVKGLPRELKTTRTFYEPKTYADLALYCEQLLCYMIAEKKCKGQLWLLLLNYKDPETKRTCPVYRCYTTTLSKKDAAQYKVHMAEVKHLLDMAMKKNDPTDLPLCRQFKCGEGNCGWWEDCQPPGRYGIPKKEWQQDERVCVMKGQQDENATTEPGSRTLNPRGHSSGATPPKKRQRRGTQ